VVARVAARLGRAPGTVRAVIAPALDRARARGPRLSARAGRVVDRLLATGREAGDIARRTGVSRRALLRAALVHRAQWLTRLAASDRGLVGPVVEAFHRADAADVLLAPEPVRAGLFWDERADDNPPIAFVERTRLVGLQFLKFRARAVIGALDRHDPASAMIDEAVTLVRWIALLRLALVRQELGAVARTLATLGVRPGGEVVARAVEAARASIDSADPASEGRLAAGVTLAVTRAIAPMRTARGVERGADRVATGMTPALAGWARMVLEPVAPLVLPAWVRARVQRAHGASEPAAWMAARHGLAGAPPRPLAELARERGWLLPRAVAFERAALRAMRGTDPIEMDRGVGPPGRG
jgi:cob(I)alamin adenosyltransferase